jgi:K+-transporting ATPase A subunit
VDLFFEDQAGHAERKNSVEMKNMLTFFLSAVFVCVTAVTLAQDDGSKVEMADTMRSNGRIFVVVAVVVVILIGLILYLVRLDRKISKLEKESDGK